VKRIACVGWVDPPYYLARLDVLLDTPTLGGLSCYWAMSAGIPVVSALPSGSIGALSDHIEIKRNFDVLDSLEDVYKYFSGQQIQPFVLSRFDTLMVRAAVENLVNSRDVRLRVGESFKRFFTDVLSNRRRSAVIQFEWLGYKMNPS
jgi:hypothetical protein